MRIHHLNVATLCPLSPRLSTGEGSWFGRAIGGGVCHALLLERPEGLLLVETGLGHADIEHPERLGRLWRWTVGPRLSAEETALSQVRAMGLDPADVRDIVVTHLDLDHAGGLPDFPNARVHVHRAELEAAQNPRDLSTRARYVPEHFRGCRFETFDDGGESWFGFGGVRSLDPARDDVLLVPLPGHSAGHCGVAVRSEGRWLLHAGDAYFFHGQMQTPPHAPFVLRSFQKGSDFDREARIRNQERLRGLALEHREEVEVFCAHDPVELDRYVT